MILKVKQNENPYDVIGNYIERHISVIDDIIAVISINGKICNELFLVEISSTSNFIWQTDWWEGEENVELIDFFFVSDACKEINNNDLISRQAALDALNHELRCGAIINQCGLEVAYKVIKGLSPAQPEIIYCKDCKHFDPIYTDGTGVCGHWNAKTENNAYCAYAERREVIG